MPYTIITAGIAGAVARDKKNCHDNPACIRELPRQRIRQPLTRLFLYLRQCGIKGVPVAVEGDVDHAIRIARLHRLQCADDTNARPGDDHIGVAEGLAAILSNASCCKSSRASFAPLARSALAAAGARSLVAPVMMKRPLRS